MANDSSSFNCNIFPSAYYGQDFIRLLYRVAQLSFVDTDMYYTIISTATFFVKCVRLYTMWT